MKKERQGICQVPAADTHVLNKVRRKIYITDEARWRFPFSETEN